MSAAKIIRLPLTVLLLLLIFLGAAAIASAEGFDCAQNRHDYLRIQYIPPAETTDGRATYECRLCGRISSRILFATGHEWSEWGATRPPTCTQPGLRTRTCHVGITHSETEEIPATGHNFVETVVAPNCTEPGRRTSTCSACGYSYIEEYGEPTGHHYIETITREPTCEHNGEITFTCEICGHYYIEPIPALTHIWSDWIIAAPAEPGYDGRRYRECIICGDRIYEPIPALPVTPAPADPPPTATEPLFGVEEVIVTGANIGLWIILLIILFGEFAFVRWRKRRKREILEQRRFAYSGKDGYKFL